MVNLQEEGLKISARIQDTERTRAQALADRDHLKHEIVANGGDRLERLRLELNTITMDQTKRQKRAHEYQTLADELELNMAHTQDEFIENRNIMAARLETFDAQEALLQNELTEFSVQFKSVTQEHQALEFESAPGMAQNSVVKVHYRLS